MKKLTILAGTFAAFAFAAYATEDPIATRQAMMQGNGGAAGAAGAMLKGELDYSPVVGKAVITSIHGVAMAFGDYFPEGSDEGADTRAAPAIWEDRAGFEEELATFREVTASAVEAAGQDGPPDLAAFQGAMEAVFDSCMSCHEDYRLED